MSDDCESCSQPAHVILADGSTWCLLCHSAALRLGYDTDLGTVLDPSLAEELREIQEEAISRG